MSLSGPCRVAITEWRSLTNCGARSRDFCKYLRKFCNSLAIMKQKRRSRALKPNMSTASCRWGSMLIGGSGWTEGGREGGREGMKEARFYSPSLAPIASSWQLPLVSVDHTMHSSGQCKSSSYKTNKQTRKKETHKQERKKQTKKKERKKETNKQERNKQTMNRYYSHKDFAPPSNPNWYLESVIRSISWANRPTKVTELSTGG